MADHPMINKIRKLLALADSARNSSEAEAQAAALKVQEMLQDYGLSLAEVEAAGGKADDGNRDKITTDRRALYQWQQSLMARLAENNFCLWHLRTVEAHDGRKLRRSKRHVLVGRQLNIDVTLATYDYIATAVRRAAHEQGFDHANNERDHHTFLDGAISRINERLRDKRREREQAEAEARAEAAKRGGQVNALVLTDVYGNEADLNNDVLNGFPAGTTAAKRRERQAAAEARTAREAELVAGGMDKTEAFYVSHGYSAEQAKSYAQQWNRRQARASRRSSTGRGWSRGWTQADERRAQRLDSDAYRAGRRTGDKVGLDTQVGGADKTRRIK